MSLQHLDRSRRFSPHLESLEERNCPSASINVFFGTMFIKGDSSANAVTITDSGGGSVTASITSSTNTATKTASNVYNIVVLTGDGADTLNYKLTGDLGRFRTISADLGKGADTANFDFASQGKNVNGPLLAVTVNGGADNDQVTASFNSISKAVAFNALLGTGNDTFTLNLNGAVATRSGASFAVFGGAGNDSMTVNAGTGVNVASKAVLALTLDGGQDNDTTTVNFGGKLDGVMSLAVAGSTGNDTTVANVTANSGSAGRLSAIVTGGQGNDILTLAVTNNSGGTLHLLKGLLDGGAGTDVGNHTANVTAKNTESGATI